MQATKICICQQKQQQKSPWKTIYLLPQHLQSAARGAEGGRGTEAEEIHLPADKGNKDETRQRKIEMLITRVEVA